MKIVHVCLAASYVEGFGYQENILSQFHAEMGNDVFVITSNRMFNKKYERVFREVGEYTNEYGIKVRILPNSKRYGYYSRFNDFDGVYDALEERNPDIIFVHGGQFVALMDIIKYCKKHKEVKLYIDQHGDYYNMKFNTWKEKIVQRYIYGHWMRKAIPYVSKYWGVTPWRCQYLNEVYRIPKSKIDLLVMGGDDRYIHLEKKKEIRAEIRSKLCLKEEDFVVITGGKIDATKNIHKLMQAVIDMNKENLKLIVFGQPNDKMAEQIEKLSKDSHIRNIGWLDATAVYDYFLASDLVVFPGTHSVLWEQACACKIPCLVKRWEGMQHVNVGGNCDFIDDDSVEGIKNKVEELLDSEKYLKMKQVALSPATDVFLYSEVAKKSIN